MTTYAVPPTSPCLPGRRALRVFELLIERFFLTCWPSFASVLDARLMASDRPSTSPTRFSTLLLPFRLRLLFRLLPVARTRTFLLGFSFLSPTPIPLFQSAHPCLPDLRILNEEPFQFICWYNGTDFDFFLLFLLPFAIRCSYQNRKRMWGV